MLMTGLPMISAIILDCQIKIPHDAFLHQDGTTL